MWRQGVFRRPTGKQHEPRSRRNSSSGVRVELHPEARAEFRSAALWYEEQREGLGTEFISEIASALDRISRTPESSPPWPGPGQTDAPHPPTRDSVISVRPRFK